MSAAQRKMVDNAILINLSPLNEMSPEHFDEVATRAKIKQFKKGEYLFREGHSDRHTFYLIKGRVALLSDANVIKTIDGGSEEAHSPLAADLPRKFTARVQSTSTLVMIDTTVLDFHLGKTTVDTYEVNDINTGDDGDWMTRILRSEAFSKLPPINLQKMLSGVSEVAYETGDTILEAGQQSEFYYIVKSGVCCESDNLTLEWHCGDAFGASGLVCDSGQIGKVIMKSSGELMLLSKADFLELCYEPLVKHTDSIGVQELLDIGCKWLDVRSASAKTGGCLRDSIEINLSELKTKLDSLNNFQAYIVIGDTPEQSGVGAFFLMQHGLNAHSYTGDPRSLSSSYINPNATPAAESATEKKITLELESEKLRLQEEVATLKSSKLSSRQSNLGDRLSLVYGNDDHADANSIEISASAPSANASSEDNNQLLAEKSELENKVNSLNQQLISEAEKRKLAENKYASFLKKVKRYKLGNDALIKKLKTQLIEGKNKLTKLVSQSAAIDTDISKVRTELDEKSSQLSNAEEMLQNKIERINELETSLTQARNDLDNVGQEFEASDDNEKVNLLQEKLKASSDEKRALEEQLKNITEDYEALQNERAEAALWDEMEDLHNALDDNHSASSNDLSDLSDMLDETSDDDLNDLDVD